jgi:hypothetical protein
MKRPRFYCESCGVEVAKDARVCPRCGRFFSSVKCPKCEHVGKADDFAFGCPVCGYALGSANPAPEPIKPPAAPAPPLPWWAFPLAALVLIALTVALLKL